MNKNFVDLTGQRFTRLYVLEYVGNSFYRCLCDCGNEKLVRAQSLRKGATNDGTKSCGCLQKEMYLESKKYNEYDLSGEFGIGLTRKNEEFYFDLENYDLIKDFCWMIATNDKYVVTNQKNGTTLLKMHRLIMDAKDGEILDHINRKKFDNRKENLRFATAAQNIMNRGINHDNTSGITGISWCESREKWETYITLNRKRIHIGRYLDFDEAIYNRLLAEKKYFGEFAPQRHLFSQYGIEV